MHGSVHKKGNRRLMFRAPSRVTASLEASTGSSLSISSSNSFSKDGRIIRVGDCALFKPPQDCQPFIGLIRSVIPETEGSFKLRVNWLYRPAELKLGKSVKAQPNEIFYSFHEDNIPAASLLHPCKVTFLPRGVGLPYGISSFVCWRVYDVMNECIWWLTDQDYTDERQEEVDKLLCKTRSVMHTTLQQDGRSPRSMNSPTTSQVKAGGDGMQNNNSSSSHGKGRKRERGDQSVKSVKRERLSRVDDFVRTESSLRAEIEKITDKGLLVDSEGVEKLVQLMLPDRNEKKIDLSCRIVLAGVVAATDKFDCLSRFVQLRGLPVFDEWLQEVHKGKIGDANSPKGSLDDFLLILLRALDKLPVNLNALQTCNIGKSVNLLRSHKNSEIGKKARSLVDTWKKRVEAEMDANQGASWPGRPRQSEVSHGSRHSGVSTDASKAHLSKSVAVKIPSEIGMKSATTSPSSTRSAPSPGTGASVVNDGKQTFHRSFSSQRSATFEKVSPSTLDVVMTEGSSNKLIVKLPKRGRSPAQSVSGGSFEDAAVGNSRAPSTFSSENHDQYDRNVKELNATDQASLPDANNALSQNSNLKNLSAVSDEVAASTSGTGGDENGNAVNTSTLGDDVKCGKRHGGSHSSMNALIESCVRDSETKASLAGADDVGMNLLATVAADAMSKSPVASPSLSRVSNSLKNDNSVSDSHKIGISDELPRQQEEPVSKELDGVNHEQNVSSGGGQLAASENVNDPKPGDLDENSDSDIEELQRLVDQCLESNEDSDDDVTPAVPTAGIGESIPDGNENLAASDLMTDVTSEKDQASGKTTTGNSVLSECKAIIVSQNANTSHLDVCGDNKIEEKQKVAGVSVSEVAYVDRLMTEKMLDDNDRNADVTLLADNISVKAERVEAFMLTVSPKVDSMDVVCDIKKEQKSQTVLSSELFKKLSEDVSLPYVDRLVKTLLDSSATNGGVEHVEASLKSIEVEAAEDCKRPKVRGTDGDEAEECTSVARDIPSLSASAGSEMEARVEFDLNEGFNGDDTLNNLSESLSLTPTPLQPSRLPPSITVTAAAKGAFFPRDELLRNKATIGWRGSAATSAFRPAEPRKPQEAKQTKTFLDFDLNVADDRLLEDVAANPTSSSGGLDLDLNKVDDPTDMNNHTISSGYRVDSSSQQPNVSLGGRMDFDLNDGPAIDDSNLEPSMSFSQHPRGGLASHSQPMMSGIRMNGENMSAGFSSWFPTASNYSAMSLPQVLPERGEQPFQVMTSNGPQRMMGPTSGVASSFTPDMYRGPVLMSSPAVPFPHTSFQYPGLPFGTSFPLASANFPGASTPSYMEASSSGRLCFPPVNSQLGVAMPSSYPRPYVVNLPNGSSSNSGVSDSNGAKWFRSSGLDLNSGPGGHETDGRDEAALVQRQQLSSAGSIQPLKDEQVRMYQMSGGTLKKKEPDGGWDGYKQSSWQ